MYVQDLGAKTTRILIGLKLLASFISQLHTRVFNTPTQSCIILEVTFTCTIVHTGGYYVIRAL